MQSPYSLYKTTQTGWRQVFQAWFSRTQWFWVGVWSHHAYANPSLVSRPFHARSHVNWFSRELHQKRPLDPDITTRERKAIGRSSLYKQPPRARRLHYVDSAIPSISQTDVVERSREHATDEMDSAEHASEKLNSSSKLLFERTTFATNLFV